MSVDPRRLYGNWDEGFALDIHINKSIYLGENENGHKVFDNTRSLMGDLVYNLKYQYKQETIYDIMKLIDPFLRKWDAMRDVDLVVPIPPSNRLRYFQPVYLIAEEIAKSLGTFIDFDLLVKFDSLQLKNLEGNEKAKAIRGSIAKTRDLESHVNILLIDDLYQTGSTLREACTILKTDINVSKIYVLTMTKTRR